MRNIITTVCLFVICLTAVGCGDRSYQEVVQTKKDALATFLAVPRWEYSGHTTAPDSEVLAQNIVLKEFLDFWGDDRVAARRFKEAFEKASAKDGLGYKLDAKQEEVLRDVLVPRLKTLAWRAFREQDNPLRDFATAMRAVCEEHGTGMGALILSSANGRVPDAIATEVAEARGVRTAFEEFLSSKKK